MKRATNLVATFGLMSISTLLIAQDLQSPGPPYNTSDIFGPELIAWSQQQRPQPVPQPLPDPPEQRQDRQPALPSNPQAEQQPAVQTFTGTIIKDHSKYALRVSNDTVYQLDDQQEASQYEGKEVKLIGTLDEDHHSVRVTSIQLIS